MADFKPDAAAATVDVGSSHRRRSEQHDGSRAGAGGSSSSGPAGSSHKTNLLGRLASFFGRNRSSGSGSGSGSSRTSSSSKKHRGGGTPSRGNKAVVVLKAKSMNDLAFPAIESWQQDAADPSSADQHHADREQQSTVPVASSASNDSLFGLREAAAASVEDVPDGGGWERLASGSRALSQSADTLSPPEGGAGIASVSSSLPSSGADGQSLPDGLGTSSRQLHRTDGRQLKQRPVSAVISALSEDDGLPWSSVDSVSSTPPTSGVDYDSSRRAASRGTAVGVIAAAMPASKRFMFASDSMLSSTHRNSDSGILSDRSTDTEEEFFRDPWRASQHAGSRRHLSSDSDSDVDAIDLDIITKTEALANPGARHKQLLRPKKSKSSVPAMPKVEEKNVLEIASCFGADGSRRQPPTAMASFGDAEIVGARLSNGPAAAADATASSTATATASSAAATAAALTSIHRRLSAANSVPPSLLCREVADAVRSRQRSSSDAAEQRDASSRTTTDSAAQAVATTETVAAATPSTGSAGETPAARAAGTSMLDVVEDAAAIQNRQPKQAAPGGSGSFLSREPATERALVYSDSDVLPSTAGRLPSASVALVSSTASSAVPDAAGTTSVTSAAAAAIPASIADAQASDDLMTGAAALAKYKSMFKQKPAIASVATPADTATHSPGDRNLDESMGSINLSNTKPPQGRRLQSSVAESRLTTSHPTTETASVSVASPMALSLSADAVVPVTVVSANSASGLALPAQPATSFATAVTIAPGVSPSEIPDAGIGSDKPSGILLPSGPVSKPVKPLPSLKALPSAGAATTKSAHVSDRPSLPFTRASRASLVGSQVLPSAASAATAVAEKTQQALPSSSGPPTEGRAAAAPSNLPHSAVDAAVTGELGVPNSSSGSRADQSQQPVSLRHQISSRKPQESNDVPKLAAAAVPAERTTIGIATAHTPGPERAPAAAAAATVDGDSDASYKRKSVRELVSQSSPAPVTVDAAAVRPSLSHGPSVRRHLQQPQLPHLSSTPSKERPGDRAVDTSSRPPAGEPAPAAGMASVPAAAGPRFPGADSSSSSGGSGTTTSRKTTALLTVGESSAAGGDTAARGSTPVALSQPRQLSIGRLPSSRSHNADQGLLPAERRLVVTTAAAVPSATGVDALPAAAAATVVAAPSATISSHHRAASAAPAAGAPNAASAVSKLTHPAPAPKPSRGLAGSNSSWTQERSRGDRGDAPTSGSTLPAALPDVLPQESHPVAIVGSAATTLPDAAELGSSPSAVSAEKAASVKDRMKLFQRR